jgi:hypothetical protein
MKKAFFFLLILSFLTFAQGLITLPTDTILIKDKSYEDFTQDFIIKNHGVLVLENCTFRDNYLGSKTNEAIFQSDRIVAPVLNYGKLTLKSCNFINNYSWNTALNDDFAAQVSAGAIVNFGDLDLSNTVFENNSYQKGHFTLIYNTFIEQFSYIGNDSIYNAGTVLFQNVPKSTVPAENLYFETGLVKNIVKNKAEIFVKTNIVVSAKITISDKMGNLVFSTSDNVIGTKTFVWNLNNLSGKKVASATYYIIVTVTDNAGNISAKSISLGVKE